LSLALLLTITSGAPAACSPEPSRTPEAGPGFEPGDEIRIEGVVIENVLNCERDLSCFLRVRSDDRGELEVAYMAPRGEPCPNTGIVQETLKIEPRTRVRVFARAIGETVLSTCPDERYTIEEIHNPPNERNSR
jgi:hypothetical protein